MIYVSSPYTHLRDDVMEARFNVNEACTAFWLRQGLPVFSPLVHCRQIATKYELPHDFDYWQRLIIDWVNSCKHVWVLEFPDWISSKGLAAEVKHAYEIKIAISYFTWDEIKNIALVPTWNRNVAESLSLLESL